MFTFLVGDPPIIKKGLTDSSGSMGSQTTLKCVYEAGGLDVDVQWYRGNKELVKNKKYTMTKTGRECSLTIKDMQSSDATQFTCVISNKLGKTDTTCKVLVNGKSFRKISS